MEGSYNARCPAVKRLLREARELHEATEEYFAQPLEDNLFEWHFTVRGPPDSDFDGGVYHGRIIMPAEYPMKPPNIIFLTANGRFETNKKICLSISGHHPETWQPSWSIRTALLAIIGFMPTPAVGTIGSLSYTPAERAILAKRSLNFNCPTCGKVINLLKERTSNNADIQREAREVYWQMKVTAKDDVKTQDKAPELDTGQEAETTTATTTTPASASIATPDPVSSPADNTGSSPNPTDSAASNQPIIAENASTTPNISSSTSSPFSDSNRPTVTSTATPPLRRSSNGVSLFLNNVLITAASALLIALVLRRLFLLESDHKEVDDDMIL